MGMLDYSRFGPLGYQDQIQQVSTDLTEAMRHRAAMAQVEQQANYHNAEIGLRQAQHKDQLAKDEAAKKERQLKDAQALQEKVNERLQAGDTEGARALIEAGGGTFGGPVAPTAPVPPAAPTSPPTPAQQEPADIHLGEDVAPPAGPADIHLGEEQPPTTDDIARRMSVPGLVEAMRARQPPAAEPPPRAPMRFDLGTIDINADVPKGQSSVTRLDPSTQGAMEMAPAEPPAPKPEAQKFTYKTPDGRTISLDPEQVRTAGRQKAAQEFLAARTAEADALFQSAAGKPPEVAARIRAEATQQRADAKRISSYIASGTVPPKEAAAQEELSVRQRQGQAITAKDEYMEAGRDRRARIVAAGQASRHADVEGRQAEEFDLKERKERSANLRKDVEHFARSAGIKTMRDDLSSLPELEAMLKSGNPQLQQNAAFKLFRMAQHDNRMSDRDAILARNVDPSLWGRLKNYVSIQGAGQMDPDVAEISVGAVKTLDSYYKHRIGSLTKDAKRLFVKRNKNYDPEEAATVLEQYGLPVEESTGGSVTEGYDY